MADDNASNSGSASSGISNLKTSFKKHKWAWIIGGIVGIIIIYFLIKFYTANNSGSSTSTTANTGNAPNTAGGYSGGYTSNGSLEGPAGPAGPQGPAGPPGKRGRRGPPGKAPKPKKKNPVKHTNTISNMPPLHMVPAHTSGTTVHADNSHNLKSRETARG